MNRQDQRRFEEIRHRLERASPGPHTVESETLVVAMPGTPEEVVIAATDLCSRSHEQDRANAAFFAAAWDDIAWLTERVRDLERALGDGDDQWFSGKGPLRSTATWKPVEEVSE